MSLESSQKKHNTHTNKRYFVLLLLFSSKISDCLPAWIQSSHHVTLKSYPQMSYIQAKTFEMFLFPLTIWIPWEYIYAILLQYRGKWITSGVFTIQFPGPFVWRSWFGKSETEPEFWNWNIYYPGDSVENNSVSSN